MKRLILVVVVLLLCVVGFGFYRGWFVFAAPNPDAGNNKFSINLTVDPDKVKEDAGKVKEEAKKLTGQATDGTR